MARRHGAAATDAAVVRPDVIAVVPESPKGPTLDATGKMIFIPGMGWMATSTFMDIYENRPQLLPTNLDLVAIHRIRERLKGNG